MTQAPKEREIKAPDSLLLGLPQDTVTEYVTETPEQIQALLEAPND